MTAAQVDQPSVAVVVGAARGIGAAIVRRLSANGVSVVAVDRDDAADARFDKAAPRAVVRGDARSDAVIHEALTAAAQLPGELRHLVHLAYVQRPSPIDTVDAAAWAEIFDVGVRSAWSAAGAFARVATTPASIVLTSSIQAAQPHPGNAAYAAAKAAVQSLTRSLAVELGPAGIRCNAVTPAYVAVERNATARRDADARESIAARNPLHHVVGPDDVAEVVAFLLSDAARAVNGVCVPVDAGQSVLPHLGGQ